MPRSKFENVSEKRIGLIGYFSAVPICGAILAASYDVGYFFGFDIGFYSLFSLSEHLLFSLEALPFALLVTLTLFASLTRGSAFFYVGKEFYSAYVSSVPPREKRKASDDMVQWFMARSPRARMLLAALTTILVVVGGYYVVRGIDYLALKFGVLWILVIGFIYFVMVFLLATKGNVRTLLALSAGAIVSIVFAFMVGHASSIILTSDPLIRHQVKLKEATLAGKIVRSGERGVLMLKSDGLLVFLRWDGILEIESNRQNAGWLGRVLQGRK